MAELFGYAALAALVGMVVGAAEILQRYRDAPFRALFSGWGIGYVAVNEAASYGAFWVLYYWIGTQPSEAREQSDPLQLLGIAAGTGFGGIAPLRARLATIRLHLRDEVHRGPLTGSAIPHQQIPIIS